MWDSVGTWLTVLRKGKDMASILEQSVMFTEYASTQAVLPIACKKKGKKSLRR